jgi:hypothetical protein
MITSSLIKAKFSIQDNNKNITKTKKGNNILFWDIGQRSNWKLNSKRKKEKNFKCKTY